MAEGTYASDIETRLESEIASLRAQRESASASGAIQIPPAAPPPAAAQDMASEPEGAPSVAQPLATLPPAPGPHLIARGPRPWRVFLGLAASLLLVLLVLLVLSTVTLHLGSKAPLPTATAAPTNTPLPSGQPAVSVLGMALSGQRVQVTGTNFVPASATSNGMVQILYGAQGSDGCTTALGTAAITSDGSFTTSVAMPTESSKTVIVLSAIEPPGSCTAALLKAQTTVTINAAPTPAPPPLGPGAVVFFLVGLLLLLLLLLVLLLLWRRPRRDLRPRVSAVARPLGPHTLVALDQRIARLEQVRSWLGEDPELSRLVDATIGARVRDSERRQRIFSGIVAVASLAAGWALSWISLPALFGGFLHH